MQKYVNIESELIPPRSGRLVSRITIFHFTPLSSFVPPHTLVHRLLNSETPIDSDHLEFFLLLNKIME